MLARRAIPVALVTVSACISLLATSAHAAGNTFPPIAVEGSTAPAPTAQGVQKALAPLLAKGSLGEVSALVIDPATGDTLLDRVASTPRTPASTTKLLTAAAALHSLGASTRLATRVVGSGNAITLVGGGDASLVVGRKPAGAASLAELAARTAKALGSATSVALTYDTSLFRGARTGPGWSSAILRTGEVAPVSAMMTAHTRASDPAKAAAKDFARALAKRGVTVTSISQGTAAADAPELARVESPQVSVLVQEMLTDSNNDLAESLGHLIGAKNGQPTFAGGAAGTLAALQDLGFPTDGITLKDASGLSHRDLIPATVQLRILGDALTSKRAELWPITVGLPVAGLTGTLADRFTSSAARPAVGTVRAKTGTLSDVVALSGTVLDRDGRLLLFSVLANKVPSVASARNAVDAIAGRLAKCGCR